jgi:hypothetical protein
MEHEDSSPEKKCEDTINKELKRWHDRSTASTLSLIRYPDIHDFAYDMLLNTVIVSNLDSLVINNLIKFDGHLKCFESAMYAITKVRYIYNYSKADYVIRPTLQLDIDIGGLGIYVWIDTHEIRFDMKTPTIKLHKEVWE